MAFAMSPPVPIPPSAMTCTYTPVSWRWRMRADRASAMAVACGTPMPSTPRVVEGGGWRCADAEHAASGAGVAGADAGEDAGRSGAHEVQRRLVRRATTDDDRDLELAHEALQVERLDGLRDVLGRHDRALDHEQVELGVDDRLGEGLGALRRDGCARHDAR